ncbi:hypothetical protein CDAR_237511 [Caerostris darwini]|uniref:Uncharacterized protein n=1 Tax=Caerostris darwini TaxID=1538125 RepID=A0AAV4NI13_9ARAC|nr:hypothetical protein CDAR_237511 [Caerostris darwini]
MDVSSPCSFFKYTALYSSSCGMFLTTAWYVYLICSKSFLCASNYLVECRRSSQLIRACSSADINSLHSLYASGVLEKDPLPPHTLHPYVPGLSSVDYSLLVHFPERSSQSSQHAPFSSTTFPRRSPS